MSKEVIEEVHEGQFPLLVDRFHSSQWLVIKDE